MSKDPKDEKTEATPAAATPAAGPAPEQEVAAARAEADALKDRLLRLQADFENFRRRAQREKAEWSLYAAESLLRELIPVIDHFELGLKTATEAKTGPAVLDGFRMVQEQFLATLKKAGLTPIDAHEASFDPHLHEAVAHVASAEHAADAIVAQTRRGWKLGDKMLRPVQVVVSSGPGAPRDDEVKREADSPAKEP